MPVLPSCLIEPIWGEFAALLPDKPRVDPSHPLGCHRHHIPDRVVFEHILDALVHGSGYERVATRACSDRTIRRRLNTWAEQGLAQQLHALCVAAFDQMIGLDLDNLSVDGCITKAVCGGDKAGPSPVDRRKGGLKRSAVTEANGLPIGLVAAGANRQDSQLLETSLTQMHQQLARLPATTSTVHLDAAYNGAPSRTVLAQFGYTADIATTRTTAPNQVGPRWVVERTHSWTNGFGKLRRLTDRNSHIVDFYCYLAAALITVRRLIQRARTHYRWPTRPTTRRLT